MTLYIKLIYFILINILYFIYYNKNNKWRQARIKKRIYYKHFLTKYINKIREFVDGIFYILE